MFGSARAGSALDSIALSDQDREDRALTRLQRAKHELEEAQRAYDAIVARNKQARDRQMSMF